MPRTAPSLGSDTFEGLYREFYRPVLGFFAKRGCSREECKDLAQETFLRAYKSRKGFRGDSKRLTWLLTIAVNVWRNHVRDASAAKRSGDEVPLTEERHGELASEDKPQDRAIRGEAYRLLRTAIDDLPAGMRRCVQLRVYQNMPYREIAEVLNVTAATAKSQVSYARPRLRALLAEHYPEIEADLGD